MLFWRITAKLYVTSYFYFTSYMLNMFRKLLYPSSGAGDYSVELPHLVVLFFVRCVLEFRCGWVRVVSVLQAEAHILFSLQISTSTPLLFYTLTFNGIFWNYIYIYIYIYSSLISNKISKKQLSSRTLINVQYTKRSRQHIDIDIFVTR